MPTNYNASVAEQLNAQDSSLNLTNATVVSSAGYQTGMVKNPRSILLPPYMLHVPLWKQLTDAVDLAFGDTDWQTGQLRAIRDPYASGPKIMQAVANGTMYDTSSAEFQQDLQVLLKQLAFNGMPLSTPSFLTAAQTLMLFRNIGEYWYSKGTGKLVDLLNFTLGSTLSMTVLWTNDYVNFVPEATVLASPGTYPPITTAGGSWFPTTHVDIDLGTAPVFNGVDVRDFITFFNDFFNYNLVLRSINTAFQITLGGSMVAMGLYVDEQLYIPQYTPDPYTFLCHFDGPGFIDQTGATITTVGGAAIVTSPSPVKFGAGSGSFVAGPPASSITTPSSSAIALNTGDFTIECWVYLQTYQASSGYIATKVTGLGYFPYLFRVSNGKLSASGYDNVGPSQAYNLSDTSNIPLNTWVHVALVRFGNSLYLFNSGNMVASSTFAGSLYFNASDSLNIGGLSTFSGNNLGGYMDDFRITAGVARYTASFIPPTAPFPNQ